MRVLVTGSEGFLGKTISAKLRAGGHYVLPFDIALDPEQDVTISGSLEKFAQVDRVYHFGSPSSQYHYAQDKPGAYIDTIAGAIYVLGTFRHTEVIFPSTSSIYGTLNDYATAKLVVEKLCDDCDTQYFRIFAGYGPNEGHKGEYASVIFQWLKAIRDDEEIEIWGDGTQSRDFVYQDDIADLLIEKPEVLDIGTGQSTSFNELIEIMAEVTGRQPKVKYLPERKPKDYLERTESHEANCETTINEGIRRTWESLQAQAKGE